MLRKVNVNNVKPIVTHFIVIHDFVFKIQSLDSVENTWINKIKSVYHSTPIHVFYLRGLNRLTVNGFFIFFIRMYGLFKLFKLTRHVFYKELHFSFQPQVAQKNLLCQRLRVAKFL